MLLQPACSRASAFVWSRNPPGLASARARWSPCAAETFAAAACGLRFVGTQTPLFRARATAAAKASAAIAARQAELPRAEIIGRRDQLVPAGRLQDTAEGLAARAHSAAVRGESTECLMLAWSLHDMPREESVHKALDKLRDAHNADLQALARRPPMPTAAGDEEETSPPTSVFSKYTEAAQVPRTTLLHAAAASGLTKVIEVLTVMKAKVGIKDEEGRTALHFAAEGSHAEAAQALLSRGRLHPDARDELGRTALRIATDNNFTGVAKVLLRFGAGTRALADDGKKPMQALGREKARNFAFNTLRGSNEGGNRKIPLYPVLGAQLPHYVQAPKLVMTPVGYCPEIEGKVVQLKKGIRYRKSRRQVSSPKCRVNWYAPRG